MPSRLIRPSKVPPEIPATVQTFLDDEITRRDLIVEGRLRDTDNFLGVLGAEYERIEAEYPDHKIDEDEDRFAFLTCTAHMVLKGMYEHISATHLTRPRLTPHARLRHAQSGLVYAELIRSSIPVMTWTESWERSPSTPGPDVLETHIVSALCASGLVAQHGNTENVLDFAEGLQVRSTYMLDDAQQAV